MWDDESESISFNFRLSKSFIKKDLICFFSIHTLNLKAAAIEPASWITALPIDIKQGELLSYVFRIVIDLRHLSMNAYDTGVFFFTNIFPVMFAGTGCPHKPALLMEP